MQRPARIGVVESLHRAAGPTREARVAPAMLDVTLRAGPPPIGRAVQSGTRAHARTNVCVALIAKCVVDLTA
jgi:hypothetical protein